MVGRVGRGREVGMERVAGGDVDPTTVGDREASVLAERPEPPGG